MIHDGFARLEVWKVKRDMFFLRELRFHFHEYTGALSFFR